LHEENQQLVKKLADAAETISSLKEQSGEAGELKVQIEQLKQQIEEAKAEAEKSKKTLKRRDLIASEFPHLLSLETEGLLPEAEGEEQLREVLSKFTSVLDKKAESEAVRLASGVTMTTPGKQSMSRNEIVSEMMKLAGSSSPDDAKRYSELADLLDTIE